MFLFQLRKRTPCKGATDLQLCSDQSLAFMVYSTTIKGLRAIKEHPSNHNTASTSLYITCCTWGQQLFTWKLAYDTTIDVMNEKSWFIRPGNFPLLHGPISMFVGNCRCNIDDND
ncbi:uncharacterized protein TNCV_3222511 [Trichonephila clavipes]|nr:uncharacterized protein TNCV_3222511 [Trichonephila clavipes]